MKIEVIYRNLVIKNNINFIYHNIFILKYSIVTNFENYFLNCILCCATLFVCLFSKTPMVKLP